MTDEADETWPSKELQAWAGQQAQVKADQKLLVYAGDKDVPAGEGLRAMPLAAAIERLRAL